MKCVKLADWSEIRDVLMDRKHDFWLSCMQGITELEFPQRIATTRVENLLAPDVFTHCFVARCKDIKAAANALTTEFGLGLRRKRVTSAEGMAGCVFALVSDSGPTQLALRHDEIAASATAASSSASFLACSSKLSSEERVRRSKLQFQVVGYSELMSAAAMASQFRGFWLTAFQNVQAEECKKRVVTTRVKDELLETRFASCLLFEAADCHVVTERLTDLHGLGQREQRVRATRGPGCLALLIGSSLDGVVKGSSSLSSPLPSAKRRTGEGSTSKVLPLSAAKRPCLEDTLTQRSSTFGSVVARCGSVAILPSRADQTKAVPKMDEVTQGAVSKGALTEVPTDPRSNAAKEEFRFRQTKVLGKRLAQLLPTLSPEKLSTAFVQERLEESMNKPAGRLDAYKIDIARIWREYIEQKGFSSESSS